MTDYVILTSFNSKDKIPLDSGAEHAPTTPSEIVSRGFFKVLLQRCLTLLLIRASSGSCAVVTASDWHHAACAFILSFNVFFLIFFFYLFLHRRSCVYFLPNVLSGSLAKLFLAPRAYFTSLKSRAWITSTHTHTHTHPELLCGFACASHCNSLLIILDLLLFELQISYNSPLRSIQCENA